MAGETRFQVAFGESEMLVRDYPYLPSTCYPERTVPATAVGEVSPGYPPMARLRCNDVLFVPKTSEDDALAFARRNHVPIVHRYDPWSFVLEPFLDTQSTAEEDRHTMQLLALNGITEGQCQQWRRRFKRAMYSYNFDSMLWEWVSLGATDLLDAHMGKLARPKFRLGADDFADLYRLVVAVLLQAAEVPPTKAAP